MFIFFPILLFLSLILYSLSIDISLFNINFFQQETELIFVNAMNNDNGDIYFEFWGKNNAVRYFIGLDYITEERLKINNNEIYSIEANAISNFHESIIVNNNRDINIFSMNSEYFDFININESKHSFKETKEFASKNNGRPSQRNCIIKLKDNTYLLSLLLHESGLMPMHYIYYKIFKFNSNDISGYEELANRKRWVNCLNSTSCIQTENQYIQCIIPGKVENGIDNFKIGIYDLNLNEQETFTFTEVREDSFTKILYIKNEIACYILFDYDKNDIQTLYIKKINC